MAFLVVVSLTVGVLLGRPLLCRWRLKQVEAARWERAAAAAPVAVALLAALAFARYEGPAAWALCAGGLLYAVAGTACERLTPWWQFLVGLLFATVAAAMLASDPALQSDVGALAAQCIALILGLGAVFSPFMAWYAVRRLVEARGRRWLALLAVYPLSAIVWLGVVPPSSSESWNMDCVAYPFAVLFSGSILIGLGWLCRCVPGGRSRFWARWAACLALAIAATGGFTDARARTAAGAVRAGPPLVQTAPSGGEEVLR